MKKSEIQTILNANKGKPVIGVFQGYGCQLEKTISRAGALRGWDGIIRVVSTEVSVVVYFRR